MTKRRWILIMIVLLLSLLIASVPRLHTIESVDVSKIADYPALQEAYKGLCEDYSLFDIKTVNTIQIVTVRNLWGTWHRYILPCFAADTPDIPRAGNGDFTAFMHILSPWDRENLFTKLCPLRLDVFGISMEPGDNAMVYQLAEIVPNVSPFLNDMHVNSEEFNLRMKHNCDKEPSLFVYYTMATLNSAQERDQRVSSEFTWSYHLRMCGYKFEEATFTLSNDHTVNA